MVDDLSIYLAKLIGLSYAFIGIALFFKPHDFQNTIKIIAKSNGIMSLISIIPLIVGLAIIIGHNIWVMHWVVLITIIGWLIFLKGILRLFFYKEVMKRWEKLAVNKKFFVWLGIVLFIVGLYLAAKGFSLF